MHPPYKHHLSTHDQRRYRDHLASRILSNISRGMVWRRRVL
jgi:hypothetical protein